MRTVVYTAIIGGKDDLKVPRVVDPGIDYICYTDTPRAFLGREPWRIVSVPPATDKVRAARRIKILAHEYVGDYERSLWVDGKVMIVDSIRPLLKRVPPDILLVWQHWQRNCTYAEARACKRRGKDAASIINRQMRRYTREGFPARYGMVRSEVLLRLHNNHHLVETANKWWGEIKRFSRRDQLSFMYACWCTGFRPTINRKQGEFNCYFRVYKHAR